MALIQKKTSEKHHYEMCAAQQNFQNQSNGNYYDYYNDYLEIIINNIMQLLL